MHLDDSSNEEEGLFDLATYQKHCSIFICVKYEYDKVICYFRRNWIFVNSHIHCLPNKSINTLTSSTTVTEKSSNLDRPQSHKFRSNFPWHWMHWRIYIAPNGNILNPVRHVYFYLKLSPMARHFLIKSVWRLLVCMT